MSESIDPNEYLSSSFDANSLTKPQLRSILSTQGVHDLPPLSAKKEILVNLFDTRIKARAEEIKTAASKIKPSSFGIVMLDKDSRPSPSKSPSKKSTPSKKGSPKIDEKKLTSSTIKSAPRGRRASSSSKKTSTSTSRTRKRAESNAPPLGLLQQALPRYADSPVSARVKLSERIKTIDTKLLSPKKKSAAHPKRKIIFTSLKFISDLLSFVLFLGFLVFISLYVRWKFLYPFPYCDNGIQRWSWCPANRESLFKLDSWMEVLENNCLSCPPHSTCFDGKMTCQDGYVKSPNIFSFGSQCIPDKKKLKIIDQIGKFILHDLSARAGKALCSGRNDEKYLRMDSDYEQRILKQIDASNKPLIRNAIEDLMKGGASGNYKIEVTSSDGEAVYWISNPRIPLKCKILNSVSAWWRLNYKFFLYTTIISILSFVIFLFVKWKLFFWNRTDEMIMIIYQMLAENASLHKRDCTIPAAIPIDQIKDAILMTQKYKSFISRRLFFTIWPEVVAKVSKNSNITETELYIRGEPMVQWEWIGMDIFSKKLNQTQEAKEAILEEESNDSSPFIHSSPLSKKARYPKIF